MPAADPNLADLASCEEEIAALRHECARLPELIADFEGKADAARARIEAAKGELEEREKERRSREGQVQDYEEQRTRFQGQSALVKTNQEYTKLLSEIDGMTERIAATEDQILELMEQIEAAQVNLDEVTREQSAVEQQMTRDADEQRAQLADAQARLAEREKQRDALVPQLGEQVERIYARAAARGSTPVAKIKSDSCSACHRAVPPEVQNRVLAGELHACQNCMAILVMPVD